MGQCRFNGRTHRYPSYKGQRKNTGEPFPGKRLFFSLRKLKYVANLPVFVKKAKKYAVNGIVFT